MNNRWCLLGFVGMAFLAACRDTESPTPPASPAFELTVRNQFNILQAQFAVFLTDADGKVRAFRWLPADDTAHLAVSDAKTGDRFDCTVAKITVLEAPGSGVKDTSVELSTYTNLNTGAELHLRDPAFLQSAELRIALASVSSLDSIVVPDGLTFARPQAANNFTGHFQVLHTGQIWLRLRINGEPGWRYLRFEQVSGATLDTVLDATTLPLLPAPGVAVSVPLLAPWDYSIDRVLDIGKLRFLPLGEPIRIPGGAIPVRNQVEVFEPAGLPPGGYRLRFSGYDALAGEGYTCDRFFNTLPAGLPAAGFDIQPTNLADNRLAAVRCSGAFDALALTRSNSGSPHLRWEVLLAPGSPGSLVSYRLPDVPKELTDLYPGLGVYQFDGTIGVRAENYDQLNDYPEVVLHRMLLDDPLWQMKAGYTARERNF